MLGYIEYIIENMGVPMTVFTGLVLFLFVINLIGEILEFKGRVVPEWVKLRKYFARKKAEREETTQTLREVKQLLADVNTHYDADNIAKRNSWMQWVNDRAEVYDSSIVEITKSLADTTKALKDNTKMTEELFAQSSRDRIIDFATKVSDESVAVSREEFNRIFKIHEKYESFLAERGLTNGEIDIAYRIITESYEDHLRHHTFVEDTRWYVKSE